MYDIQLDSNRLRKIKEEMVVVYSNLTNALKEIVTEQEYLSGVWKGEAAEAFIRAQNYCMGKIEECADKTEALLLFPEQTEEKFRQCEKQVSKVIGEWCIWEI